MIFIFCFCLFFQTKAQITDDYDNLIQYTHDFWSTKNGLPTQSINAIIQSYKGYLWMATYEGIVQFDGMEFKIYNTRNTKQFLNNAFYRLSQSKDSSIWFASPGNGLVRIKNNDINIYGRNGNKAIEFNNIFIDSKDRIWSDNPTKGVFYFDQVKSKFIYPEKLKKLQYVFVYEYAEDVFGNLFIGTEQGLYKYNNDTLIYIEKIEIAKKIINSLYIDHKNNLWIGTQTGLFYYDGDTVFEKKYFKNKTIQDIKALNDNEIWIATTKEIYQIKKNPERIKKLLIDKSIYKDFIVEILFDSEKNLWIIQQRGGLSRIRKNKFAIYDHRLGLHSGIVNSVFKTQSGGILIAFDEGRIYEIKTNQTIPLKTNLDLTTTRIRHILTDSQQNLWISTYNGLLKKDNKGKETLFTSNNGFPSSKIRVAFEDSENNIWIGTRDVGLIKLLNDHTFKIFDHHNNLNSNIIMSIDEDLNGNILVNTAGGGLFIINDDAVIDNITVDDGLISNIIFNTYCDTDGYVWVATNSGLSIIKDRIIYNPQIHQDLNSTSVYDIIEDKNGYLWMPFALGLMRLNRKNLIQFVSNKTDSLYRKIYDNGDGIPMEGFTPVAQSTLIENKILIPTLSGLLSIEPDNILSNNIPPPVFIKHIFADNDTLNLSQNITIEENIRRVTFSYTAICFHVPEKVKYKYKLLGYENNWNEVSSTVRTATYTNLPYGYYTFKVIACNNDGVWNNKGAKISFYVKPYWYETTLFKILLILFLIGFFIMLYYYRLTRLKKRQLFLENEIKKSIERIIKQNEKLEDLNAAKDKFFNIIAHDLRNPFSALLGFSDLLNESIEEEKFDKTKEYAEIIRKTGQNVFQLLEDLLSWSRAQSGKLELRIEEINILQLFSEIHELTYDICKNKAIKLRIANVKAKTLDADYNMVKTILMNLVTNAVKFSHHNSEIILSSSENESYVNLYVQDFGVGMNKEIQDKLFMVSEKTETRGTLNEKGTGLGLLICKEFVEKHHGLISIKSEIKKGSTFTVSFPKR